MVRARSLHRNERVAQGLAQKCGAACVKKYEVAEAGGRSVDLPYFFTFIAIFAIFFHISIDNIHINIRHKCKAMKLD